MRDVDYVKLSELYASFLIAIGGVSITVLSIVSALAIVPPLPDGTPADEPITRSFLSAALIVATVSCFIGAHMMAETAAFVNYFKEKMAKAELPEWDTPEWTPVVAITFGKRLFLLASTNIFVSVILVLFAIVLLPAAKGPALNIQPVYFIIFASVGVGALYWMYLASQFRMPVKKRGRALLIASAAGIIWFLIFFLGVKFSSNGFGWIPVLKEALLLITFTPIVLVIVATLIYFASIFKNGSEAIKDRRPGVNYLDTGFFGAAVAISYASLVVAGIKLITAG